MIKRLLPSFAAAAALALCAGCLFPKNFDKQKADPHAAASLEIEFHHRWMEKRVGDLTATGMSASAAQAQAEAEFQAKYSYAEPVKK